MTTEIASNPLDELVLHLESQRRSALELIDQHNRILASLVDNPIPASDSAPAYIEKPATDSSLATAAPAPAAKDKRAAIDKGNVVSLFDSSKPQAPEIVRDIKIPATDKRVFQENDVAARSEFGAVIDDLLARYGADDALAINRKHMAGTIFLSNSKEALFYMRENAGVLFVVCYVGDDSRYQESIAELKAYAEQNDLLANFMVQESRVNDLKEQGFSTTPIGIWQRVENLAEFTLGGQKMRRLRYLVSKYTKQGDCKTIEYAPGTNPKTDQAICDVIDDWVALKGQNVTYVPGVKEQLLAGGFGKDHRFFLTYRESTLDNVIVFSRDNYNDGYLMDLEFYGENMPLGSTEFALTEIIALFRDEGRKVVSLGLTMGTGLFEHENGSSDVHKLFEQLKKAEFVNGDDNAQYKNKYRPQTSAMYLARPHDSGKKKLNDLLMLLGTG